MLEGSLVIFKSFTAVSFSHSRWEKKLFELVGIWMLASW